MLRMMPTPPRILWPDPADCPGLSEHQREQLARATAGRFGLLTGTPGTGKTYTVGSLVDVLAEQYGRDSIALCAPTGKAAVRMTAAVRRSGTSLTATTIHTLLGIQRNGHDGDGWGFAFNANNPLQVDFVIADETSMIDTDLAASLLAACSTRTHVLWVGDPYQLSPVGHGAPLRDLIAARVPTGELREIHRNAGLIVHACAAIKDGKRWETCDHYDKATGLNLRHIDANKPERQLESLSAILQQISTSSKNSWHPVWDVQVILALNDKGPLARREVNRILQDQLNPFGCPHPDHHFRQHDKVICLKNHWAMDFASPSLQSHYVANGEIGKVLDVADPGRLVVELSQPDRIILAVLGKKVSKDSRLEDDAPAGGDWDLAYAITGHKFQGSQAPVVIVLIDESGGARRVCSREWLYTCLSRAEDLCITVGRRGVMEQFARRPQLEKRKTFLRELITGETSR